MKLFHSQELARQWLEGGVGSKLFQNPCIAFFSFSYKKYRWPSGKMLGGSSGLNYMLGVRGEGADYDSWAEVEMQS